MGSANRLADDGHGIDAHVVTPWIVTSEYPHTFVRTTPGGCTNRSIGRPRWYRSMNSFQMYPAPSDPATFAIGELSVFPTHAPTTNDGVKPIVSESL